MSILCACERTQSLTLALLDVGLDAYSCDLDVCLGSCPSRHIVGDCMQFLDDFDHVLAFPPCTHLTYANGLHLNQKLLDGRTEQAISFFMALYHHPKTRMVENPLGVVSKFLKYSQIVSPEMFGSDKKKRTCLWLKGLPLLLPTSGRSGNSFIQSLPGGSFYLSALDPYLAKAMAVQWAKYLV